MFVDLISRIMLRFQDVGCVSEGFIACNGKQPPQHGALTFSVTCQVQRGNYQNYIRTENKRRRNSVDTCYHEVQKHLSTSRVSSKNLEIKTPKFYLSFYMGVKLSMYVRQKKINLMCWRKVLMEGI